MNPALLIDFGSTYTKLRAVDMDRREILGAGHGPSTVTTDITIGMKRALDDLEHTLGVLPRFKYRLASSSAAGGLRMVTIGLVRELTAEAARRAALGAGARLIATFAYRLTRADMEQIAGLRPDIVLLAGGTDGGNSDVILHNARMLAASTLACPIVYAGNRAAFDDASAVLDGKSVLSTENVMPEFGVLNIDPARATIRQLFIDRIVHAKGLDRAQSMFDRVLMPTPLAVMEGARLLADGCANASGLGELMVIDPGGATTDVHSVASGEPSTPGTMRRGLPEPRVKRTVEGDLGMRHNASAIVDAAGAEEIASASELPVARVTAVVDRYAADVQSLPGTEAEERIDTALARAAVKIAVRRHCGTLETVMSVNGPVMVQQGKDLSLLKTMIGTGGPLVHAPDPRNVLSAAMADAAEPMSLRPRAPRLLIDQQYVLYACGLLSTLEPEAALELGMKYMVPVGASD